MDFNSSAAIGWSNPQSLVLGVSLEGSSGHSSLFHLSEREKECEQNRVHGLCEVHL